MPEFTGERVLPGLVDVDLLNEHQSRYEFAKQHAAGRRVLDAGCGSGYGAAELAKSAGEVTAIDSSEEAIQYAREHYAADNLNFEQGLCTALPTGPFELITAFEVIEHLEEWPDFLAEVSRVLAPGGRFLVSTPNKSYYAESRKGSGVNPFHVHEFEFAEFEAELRRVFGHVAMFVQNHCEGILFAPLSSGAPAEIALRETRLDPEEAHFYVALCAKEPLPPASAFVWIPSTANVLREREHHIDLLQGEVALRTGWMEDSRAELETRNREYESLLDTVRDLNVQIEQRNRWAQERHAESEERARRIFDLQEEFAREQENFRAAAQAYEEMMAQLETTSAAKTEWALETERRLGAEIADRSRDLGTAVEVLHEVEKTLEERTLWAQGLDRELASERRQMGQLRGSRWVRLGMRLNMLDRA